MEDEERIGRNPCRIRGGGEENAPARPMVDLATVFAVADLIRRRYRAMVLLAGLGGLRSGESLGLRRRDVNCLHQAVSVEVQAQEVTGRGRILKTPKSEAGARLVVMPRVVMETPADHLALFTGPAGVVVGVLAGGGVAGRRPGRAAAA